MRDYIQGALLGCAIGDALGMPYEGLSIQECQKYTGKFIDSTKSRHTNGLTRGQYTDDTQMTIAILESIVAEGGVNIEDIGKKFAKLYSDRTLRGGGRSTKRALKRISQGDSAYGSGTPDAHGCGTAMRSGLLGFLPLDGRGLEEVVLNISDITHDSNVARSAAMAMTYSVAFIKEGRKLYEEQQARRFVEHIANISSYECPLEFNFKQNLLQVADLLHIPTPEFGEHLGNSGLANESTVVAIHAFLRNQDSFEDCMKESITGGGDTDSIAAMAGTLYGAQNGISAFANKYIVNVENAFYLRELAAQYANVCNSTLEPTH